jgi:hypothetical protein
MLLYLITKHCGLPGNAFHANNNESDKHRNPYNGYNGGDQAGREFRGVVCHIEGLRNEFVINYLMVNFKCSTNYIPVKLVESEAEHQ